MNNTPTKHDENKTRYRFQEISSTYGCGESCEVSLVTDMEEGKSWIKLKMSYFEKYETKDLDKAIEDMKKLTGSGYITDIQRLVKLKNIDVANEHLKD